MKEQEIFWKWLEMNGAEILSPTNPYEFARFVARGGVHVIYSGRRGISANGFAMECLDAFKNNRQISMGFAKRGSSKASKKIAAIILRDGRGCFYCGRSCTDEEATVEHLIARQKGGPDHMDNLALSCKPCNQRAGHLPLAAKIRMRDTREASA